jgi:hypothetical protein
MEEKLYTVTLLVRVKDEGALLAQAQAEDDEVEDVQDALASLLMPEDPAGCEVYEIWTDEGVPEADDK